MGVVYKAFDPELGRTIALKLLNTDGASSGGHRDRLLREAQALARLSHPNVVAVHDVGTFGDDVFIAMEFVEGQTLREWLKEKPRGQREILDVFLAAGQGLSAAHRAGLVHRDFKPENVVVGMDAPLPHGTAGARRDGRVRVLDFGLARDTSTGQRELDGSEPANEASARQEMITAVDGGGAARRPHTPDPGQHASEPGFDYLGSRGSLSSPLTRVGSVLGTPRYMAPEQHRGETADERADQFSFCVALYEALYGQAPFAGRELAEFEDSVLAGQVQEPPPGARVPRRLRLVLLRGLAVNPGDRYPSMDALMVHLAPPRVDRAHWFTLGAIAVALGLVAWGGLGWRAHALERAQLCQGAPKRLAGVWDDAAKRRVHDALLATGKPYAADAWSNVEATLDRYAARWAQMHRDSCEATRLRGEQTDAVMTLRMACLDRKLQGMSALAAVLAEADGAMLEKAGSAAAGLGSLEECADVPGLLAETSPPSDPALRERISAIRAKVSRVAALRLAGRIPTAVELGAKAAAEARETGDPVILAEALTEEGRARSYLEPERAAPLLTEAFWAALSGRRDRAAVVAATSAMRSYALTLHFDDAAQAERFAQTMLVRIGGDDELESDLWAARSLRALEQQRPDEQLTAASRAARLSERRFGLDDLRTFAKQQNELNAISDASRNYEAWQRRVPLLERQEKQLGLLHPMVARALMDLGDDEVNIGHLVDARAHLEASEKLLRDLDSTTSVGWTTLRTYQLRLADVAGRRSEVEALAHETLDIFERTGRGDSDLAISARIALAVSDAQQGHETESIRTLRRLMQDALSTHGKDYPLGPFYEALAEVHLRAGQLAEARDEAERNVALALQEFGEGTCRTAEARLGLRGTQRKRSRSPTRRSRRSSARTATRRRPSSGLDGSAGIHWPGSGASTRRPWRCSPRWRSWSCRGSTRKSGIRRGRLWRERARGALRRRSCGRRLRNHRPRPPRLLLVPRALLAPEDGRSRGSPLSNARGRSLPSGWLRPLSTVASCAPPR